LIEFIKHPEERKEIINVLKNGEKLKDRFISLKVEKRRELKASLSIEPNLDEAGKPVKAEIALMDVTDRIKAEEERVALEKKLGQSERLASVGKLAMGFAHEISNPLTNIQLASEILSLKEDKEVKNKVHVITKNVDLASSVVRNLLDFSRQTKLSMRLIQIEPVLDDSLDMISPRLRDVEIIKRLAKTPEIMGDSKQLQQVFANILINAVQAMPTGGKITIKSGVEKSNIFVSFNDNGPGIPKEQLEKIFDPFYTTKEVGMGTGLGLSLSYGIVKAHGGDVVVQSRMGKGTTVTVKLPLETKGKVQ
jgi:two-component system NtrC family sensor kinase